MEKKPAGGDKMRTHMMFSKSAHAGERKNTKRRGKSPKNLLMHHDQVTQTVEPGTLDYTQWTGNQRIMHYGPLATRDPFFYYYPKGWDILYPAQFGFFPYRTKSFRGSSPMICLSALGFFFILGGVAMTYVGYFHSNLAAGDFHPLKIAGPFLLATGLLSLIIGGLWWLCTLQLCNEHLRHSQPHHIPPRKTVKLIHNTESEPKVHTAADNSPYMPPCPPIPTVLANDHTDVSLYTTDMEMKLYPPSVPGYDSTTGFGTLQDTLTYVGSPYNTLSTKYSTNQTAGRSIKGAHSNTWMNRGNMDTRST